MDPDFEFQLQCEEQEKRSKAAQAATETKTASSLSDASGVYTDPDGTVYEWDTVRRAWFPKIDSDFIAMYQASYGVPTTLPASSSEVGTSGAAGSVVNTAQRPENNLRLDSDLEDEDIQFDLQRIPKTVRGKTDSKKRKKPDDSQTPPVLDETGKPKKKVPEPPVWFEVNDEKNRNVYVSNLPGDVTEEELIELMSKCGIIMKDPRTNNFKLKLYRESDGSIKGDALCTYMKVESVPLALQILDGYRLRNNVLKVERASFHLKGEFDVEKAKKQKLKKNEKKRMEKAEAKLLDWRPDKLPGTRPKNEKVVVIKNMFDTKEFEADPSLILEFKKDLQLECEKFGEVKKVIIYDRNPEGVATIGFAEFDKAASCIARMNGRFFAGRQLAAAIWDGKTKYKIEESEEEEQKRLGQWEKYIDESPQPTS